MLYLTFVNLPILDTITWLEITFNREKASCNLFFEDLLFDVLNNMSLPFFEVFGPLGPTVLREQSVAQETHFL